MHAKKHYFVTALLFHVTIVTENTWILISESGRFSRISSPDALSTHERDPYNNVIGTSFRRAPIRLTIGCLAQPKLTDMAWKAASPLQKNIHSQIST